ncbi:hypothetical protein GQ473_02760, partial [archaeon]|nr:hypothetical protein [archaeon]
MTVYRDTTYTNDTFLDVIASISFDDFSMTENVTFLVDFYGNGTYFDITPRYLNGSIVSGYGCKDYTFSVNMTGIDDSLNDMTSAIFGVCQNDTDSNTRIDSFLWTQPILTGFGRNYSIVKYKILSSANSESVLKDEYVTTPLYFGEMVNYTVNVTDSDGDFVNVTLWTSKDNITWVNGSLVSLLPPDIIMFNKITDNTWTGTNYYLFEYQDVNFTTYEPIRSKKNTTIYVGPVILRHNITVYNITLNESVMNLQDTASKIVVYVNDTYIDSPVNNTIQCLLWIKTNGIYEMNSNIRVPNSSGYCVFSLYQETYEPGIHEWKVNISQSVYYGANTTDIFILNFSNELVATVDFEPLTPGAIYRNNITHSMQNFVNWTVTNIRDANGNPLLNVSYNVTFDGLEIDSGVLLFTNYFNGSYNISSQLGIGSKELKVFVEKDGYGNYTYSEFFDVYGDLNINITQPLNNSIVYKNFPNNTIMIKANVTDELNNTIDTASVIFNMPVGSCVSGVINDGSGIYSCDYMPDLGLVTGNYSWSANVTTSYYNSTNSFVYTIYIRDNLTASVNITPVSPGPLYKTGSENLSINWSFDSITDGILPIDDVFYYVYFDSNIVDFGLSNSTGANGTYFVNSTDSVGGHMFRIIVGKDTYRNYTYITSYDVAGITNITIVSPSNLSVIYKTEPNSTIVLKANVTDEFGVPINTSLVTFYMPSGYCLYGVLNEGNGIYNCTYEVGLAALLGSNLWYAKATTSGLNDAYTENNTLIVSDNITATTTFLPIGDIYRYVNSLGNTSINWSVINIRDLKLGGSVYNVSYFVYWDLKLIENGITSSDINSTFDVPFNDTVGQHSLKIKMNKTNWHDYVVAQNYDVYGTLNVSIISPQNNSNVYKSGANSTVVLKLNVSDDLGIAVTDASVVFNIPAGQCLYGVLNEGNGLYNCTYEPSSILPVGNYTWSSNVSKVMYESVQSDLLNLFVYDRATISIINDGSSFNRTFGATFNAQLEKQTLGNISQLGINCSWYVGGSYKNTTITNAQGICSYSLDTGCLTSYIPEQYSVLVEFNGSFINNYEILNNSSLGSFNVVDNTTINITLPNGVLTYNTGDIIDLNSTFNDSCGVVDSLTPYTIYWNFVDVDTDKIISTGSEGTWTVTNDAYGTSIISAYVDSLYYLYSEDNIGLSIGDVLNIDLLSVGSTFNRTMAVISGGENFTFNARIETGNGVEVNASGYNGTWSGYNCSWYVDDSFIGNSTTDANGTCNYDWNASCSFNPNSYNAKVLLSGNVTPDYPVFQNVSEGLVYLKDSPSVIVVSPFENDSYDYLDTILLNATVVDSCGITNESMGYSFNWLFSDIDNPSYTLGTVNEWIVPSFAFGDSNITATVLHQYFYPVYNITPVDVIRTIYISDFNVPPVMLKDSENNISCSVNMNGIIDMSGYNVTFYIDQNYTLPYMRQTNMTGTAVFTWNTTGYVEGPHNVECNLTNDIENGFYASSVYAEYYQIRETMIPTDMNISAYFIDNREINLYDGGHFVDENTVYRNSMAPMYEPDVLFLAANITTIWSSGPKAGQLKDIDNVTVYFNILNKTTGEFIDSINCITNITEYNLRGTTPPDYVQENFWDNYWNYVCLAQWNPDNSIDVGEYTLKINVTKFDSPGWSTSNVSENIIVMGLLNVTIIDPIAPTDSTEFPTDGSYLLKVNVSDDAGKVINPSDDVNVTWYYELRDYCSPNLIGENISGISYNYDWKPWSYISGSWLWDTWEVRAKAYGNYYETDSIWTQATYNNGGNCLFNEDNRLHWDRKYPNIYDRMKTTLVIPSEDITERNQTTELVTFVCRVERINDSYDMYTGYPVNLICENCADAQNQVEFQNTTDNGGEAYFYLNFSNESVGGGYKYNITCEIENYTAQFKTEVPYNNHTREIMVVDNLGSGGGSCNFDGFCNVSASETCSTCPEDCGFEKLPEAYKFPIGSDGCGCNNNYICETLYESTTSCGDCDAQEPVAPDIKDNQSTSYYVRSLGTFMNITADVRDLNSDLEYVWLYDNETLSFEGFMTTIDGGPLSSWRSFKISKTFTINTTFIIKANDTFANVNDSQIILLMLDDTLPIIINFGTDESDNIVKNAQLIRYSTNTTDNTGLFSSVRINGTDMVNGTGDEWSVITTPAMLGCTPNTNCTLMVVVSDIAQNIQNDTIEIVVDDTNPNIWGLSYNTTFGNISKSTTLLNISVYSNDTDGVYGDLFSVKLNDTVMSLGGGELWSVLGTPLSFGCVANTVCSLSTVSTDYAGNKENISFVITVDDINPTIWNFNSNATNNISSTEVPVNFTVYSADDDGLFGNVSGVNINGTAAIYAGGDLWYVVSNLSSFGCLNEGPCSLVAVAYDQANNSNSIFYTPIINNSLPNITITLSQKVFDDSPDFSVETDEDANCTYKTDYNPLTYTLMDVSNGLNHNQTIPTQNVTYISTNGKYNYIQHHDYMNGNHTLFVNCTDMVGSVSLKQQNFVIKTPIRDRVFYQEGNKIILNLILNKTGLDLSVNFSKLDSGYNNSNNESVTDLGGGNYSIEYNVSSGNTYSNSHNLVYVIVNDSGIVSSNTTIYIPYQKQTSWSWDDVNDVLTCRGGNPGWYFDEVNCNWDADVNFANKKNAGAPREEQCEDGLDNDGDGKTDCVDTDCQAIFYTCRENAGIDMAITLYDPCVNNVCDISLGGTIIHFLQKVKPGEYFRARFVQNNLVDKAVLLQINNITENFTLSDVNTTIVQLPTKITSSTSVTSRSYTPDGESSNDTFTGNLKEYIGVRIPNDGSLVGVYDTQEFVRSIDDDDSIQRSTYLFNVDFSAIVNESDGGSDYCNDTIDNDLNGFVDCALNNWDVSCNNTIVWFGGISGFCELGGELNCTDGFDNDRNGIADCADIACDTKIGNSTNATHTCQFGFETNCVDDFDNDGDTFTDCGYGSANGGDYDCSGNPICPVNETCDTRTLQVNNSWCSDGIDNDLDGYTDCNFVNPDTVCNNTMVTIGIETGMCQIG